MRKAILLGLFYIILMIGLIGCGGQGEIGYKPPIVIPIRVSINTNGELKVELTKEIVTSIGTFDFGGGVTIFSVKGQYEQKVLIVRVDDKAVVYELEEGKEFHVSFDDSNTLYRKVALQYESDGDIVLELESVNGVASPAPSATSPGGEPSNITDNFYDMPEDGEVLNRFCTDDWETCRSVAVSNANWQDIEVASIGGGSPSDGYLIERTFLFFDTSGIPSSATIQSAVLYVHAGQWLNGNTTIHVVRSSANIPLTTSSFQKFTNVSGGSVTLTTPFDWASISLDNSALSWITPGGVTKLALIHDNDLNDVTPSEPNDVLIATGEDSVNRPYLMINYTTP
jgi:hypothetical protein